jgi:hypothetical protein
MLVPLLKIILLLAEFKKAVQVFPVIDKGTQEVEVNGNQKTFDFSTVNFTETPIIVASLNYNPSKEKLYTVSAIAKSTKQYALEVTSTKDNTGTKVSVNWIAVQMKQIELS